MTEDRAYGAARRLLAHLEEVERIEPSEAARDEAQRLLLERHLVRIRKLLSLDGEEHVYYSK